MTSQVITPTKCVYFVGPASTGKTTLAKALLDKCIPDTFFLTEVARTVLGKLKYNADDISNDPVKCYDLQKNILLAQCRKEKELLKMNEKFISDRSAIDPIVYAEFFITNATFELLVNLEEWHMTKLRYQDKNTTLIVLIEPNEAFLKDDGIRKMPTDLEDWHSFYRCFISFMNQHDIPFKIIPRNLTKLSHRMEKVIEWMQS